MSVCVHVGVSLFELHWLKTTFAMFILYKFINKYIFKVVIFHFIEEDIVQL